MRSRRHCHPSPMARQSRRSSRHPCVPPVSSPSPSLHPVRHSGRPWPAEGVFPIIAAAPLPARITLHAVGPGQARGSAPSAGPLAPMAWLPGTSSPPAAIAGATISSAAIAGSFPPGQDAPSMTASHAYRSIGAPRRPGRLDLDHQPNRARARRTPTSSGGPQTCGAMRGAGHGGDHAGRAAVRLRAPAPARDSRYGGLRHVRTPIRCSFLFARRSHAPGRHARP